MITRYALFQGAVAAGRMDAFRRAVESQLLPTWTVYPGVAAVRVSFATERDEGAPECPLVLPGLFDGKIHHYVTETRDYTPA